MPTELHEGGTTRLEDESEPSDIPHLRNGQTGLSTDACGAIVWSYVFVLPTSDLKPFGILAG